MKRNLLYIAAALVGIVVTLVLVSASVWPVINRVETGKTAEYPEVQPQYYTADPARVFDEVRGSVMEMEAWSVATEDRNQGTLSAVRNTRFDLFQDDVEIRVEAVTEFATSVNVVSKSRVGKGDLGQNARNIEELFAELNQRLGALRFDPNATDEDKETAKK